MSVTSLDHDNIVLKSYSKYHKCYYHLFNLVADMTPHFVMDQEVEDSSL